MIFLFPLYAFSESDVSFLLKPCFSHTDYIYNSSYYHYVENPDFKIAFENYNFPFKNKHIGFFEGVNFGFSDDFSFDIYAGPSFSLGISDFCNASVSPAGLFSFQKESSDDFDVVKFAFGFLNEFRFQFELQKHFALNAGFDFSFRFFCYQIEETSLYISHWTLEDFTSFAFSPFLGFSYIF